MKLAWLPVALALVSARAQAYPQGHQFDVDPMKGTMNPLTGNVEYDGSGGIVFTGAPRVVNHTCDVCHLDPPRQIGAKVEADQTTLFTQGWQAGTTYHLRVVMTKEHEGLNSMFNNNGFALEIDDVSGAPTKGFQVYQDGHCVTVVDDNGSTPDAYLVNDGTAITHNGMSGAQTTWDLCWTAPPAGTGPLTLYLAVVDGNGGKGTADFASDVTGDDVFSGAVPIVENGGPAAPSQQGACQMAGRGTAGAGAIVLLLVGLAHRRLRGLLLLLLVFAGGSGCASVKPWQKERLAKRIMKFAPDPDEDELDLHMLEAREGSSGGYGSAGGGCGCN